MPSIYVEVDRKADYITHTGTRELVPYKMMQFCWIQEELCESCTAKINKKGKLSFESGELKINDVCQKCKEMICFQRTTL